MSNFDFLKNKNANLYAIIVEAEQLFRDEYFSQVTIQLRRFAENLCKDLLGDDMPVAATFDDMINCLKDKSFDNIRLKEFVDDLFYLKKQGNNSVHSSFAKNDGKIALECIERAFEIAIFYVNQKFGYQKNLDCLVFSEEILMTGKSMKKSLKAKYVKELEQNRADSENNSNKYKTRKKKTSSLVKTPKPKKSNSLSKAEIGSIIYRVVVISVLLFIMVSYLYSCAKSLFHF